MKNKHFAILALTLGIIFATIIFHAGQYTYIRVFYGVDAPFEDFTSLAGLYYQINEWVDFLLGITLETWEDGSFRIIGCLPNQICS